MRYAGSFIARLKIADAASEVERAELVALRDGPELSLAAPSDRTFRVKIV